MRPRRFVRSSSSTLLSVALIAGKNEEDCKVQLFSASWEGRRSDKFEPFVIPPLSLLGKVRAFFFFIHQRPREAWPALRFGMSWCRKNGGKPASHMPIGRHFHLHWNQQLPTMSEMYIIKRDGRKESVHFDKITSRISKLCYSLNPKVRFVLFRPWKNMAP